jgi:hypothetical protein
MDENKNNMNSNQERPPKSGLGCLWAYLIAGVIISLIAAMIIQTYVGGGIGWFSTWFGLIFLIPCAAFPLVLLVWAVVDCARYDQAEDKLIWILIIIFVPFIGGLLYLLIRRPQRNKLIKDI